ncbi:Zn-ribbon domain-containing OB-fold protein [Candidatus Bathyarchaeota archaeon]|nr:Zn-ribbon domain-containing OB-fold protein [Candidatus Bathyarchaeota archaeon]
MIDQEPFTIEQFYRYVAQKKLMGGRCIHCGKIYLPPRPLCGFCFSKDFDWVELSGKGKLLTYTIIHVAPPQFQSMTPYVVGIIGLEKGLRLPGIITGVAPEQIRIGMDLSIEFEICSPTESWPQWARYCFKPM